MQKCLICSEIIKINPKSHSNKTKKFCSYKCYWQSLKGRNLSEETKEKISKIRKENPVRSVFKSGNPAPKTSFKCGHIPWNKGIIWEVMRGQNHPNWKDGISERIRKYNRKKSKEMAKQSFSRDGYKCVDCSKKERILNAHHIKSWKDYPELRFNLDNLVTLCVKCHKIRHSPK